MPVTNFDHQAISFSLNLCVKLLAYKVQRNNFPQYIACLLDK